VAVRESQREAPPAAARALESGSVPHTERATWAAAPPRAALLGRRAVMEPPQLARAAAR